MSIERRLIDANALRAEFMELADTSIEFDAEGVANAIANAPTVDAVEVVNGRWELVEYQSSPFGVDQEYQCSICGTPTEEDYRTRYCPNCGAKMDGERREGE